MKIQYVASDGKIFEHEKECRDYEKRLFLMDKKFLMFDNNLKITNEPDNAIWVYFKDATEGQQLIEFFNLLHSDSSGIDPHTYGWYYYFEDRYIYPGRRIPSIKNNS